MIKDVSVADMKSVDDSGSGSGDSSKGAGDGTLRRAASSGESGEECTRGGKLEEVVECWAADSGDDCAIDPTCVSSAPLSPGESQPLTTSTVHCFGKCGSNLSSSRSE